MDNKYIFWSTTVLVFLAMVFVFRMETEEDKAIRLDIEAEKALQKELLAEGIDFIKTGKCFNYEDDINKKLLFGSAFGNYVIDKADSPLGEFPRDPVPFKSKAWNKCYGRSKVIDTYQLGDGRMYKSKTYFYKSIKAQVKVNTNRNYIESFIFDFSSN